MNLGSGPIDRGRRLRPSIARPPRGQERRRRLRARRRVGRTGLLRLLLPAPRAVVGVGRGEGWSPHPRHRSGTGREALALQAMGKEVLALDVSPGAIEVCRRRGVVSTFLGTVHDLAVSRPEPFDSCLAFNSLSLVFNPTDAVGLLDALSAVGHPDWALVGQEGAPGRRTPRAALSPPETRGRDHGCVDGRCHQGADGPHGALERGGCPAVPARRSRSGPSGSRRARHARGRSPNAR